MVLRALSLPFTASLVFFLITPTATQPLRRSSAEVRQQIVEVVEGQFRAFRDGDYARAYSFAATGLQQQFTVPAFERMVKDNYPIIAYWRAVSFGPVEDNGRVAVMELTVQGRGGRTRVFRYQFVREPDGWRINGVVEVRVSPESHGQAA
jgi:hypothetical protein